MAKVCALSAPGFLLGVFFGFGGLFFRLLCVVVIGGRPEGGEGTALYIDCLSSFATFTVSSLGRFPWETSDSTAGRSASMPCLHALRPSVRVRSTRCLVFGRYGTPWAWTHDGALPLRHFLQAKASLPIEIRFAGEKF
jgi:hypothetical protein